MENNPDVDFVEAEKLYKEWEKTAKMLQEEVDLVKKIQHTGQLFRTVSTTKKTSNGQSDFPSASTASASSSSAASSASSLTSPTARQSASDAALQAQHLAQQAATDIRDPDVWPPPTTEAPVRPAQKRVSSVGAPFQHHSAPPAAAPQATPAKSRHEPSLPSRTPAKPPTTTRENGGGDDEPQTSARLPDWANRKSTAPTPAVTSSSKPPTKVRRPSTLPPGASTIASSASSSSSSSASNAAAAEPTRGKRNSIAPAARKPAIPTAGRRATTTTAPSSSSSAGPRKGSAKGDEEESASKSNDGGRPKFEAPTKEEQEMADMIEREILDKTPNVKMADIAGLAGAKRLLTEAVVFPRLIPGYFTGKRKPWKGILLFGPPGTGKTLLAKAVATECNTTFFNVSPSTVTSKYRGDSEKLMKLLFEMARFYAPSTIFMDEVDGLCSARGGGGEHEASRRVKGEILQQMDGANAGEYDPAKSVIVLGATNLPWELDTAFLRRFEKRVHIDLPDVEGRLSMFQINTEGVTVAEDVSENGTWKYVVDASEGYSGADIAVVCNDASMLGLRRLVEGKTPDEMKKMDKNQFNVPISRADFEQVFQTVKSSAGKQDLDKYRQWSAEFGSTI